MPRPSAPVLAVLGLSAALTPGCASRTPDPLDPRAELAALDRRSLAEVLVVRPLPGSPGERRPPRPFDPADGLDEEELVAAALALNPDLRAKRLAEGEALAGETAAGVLPNPELGLSAGRGLSAGTGWQMDADFLFEVLLPSARSARLEAAGAAVAEARARILADEWALVAAVRRARLGLLAAERGAALADEEAALRARLLGTVARRREIGEASETDAVAAELDLAESDRDRARARAEEAAARRGLVRLLGLPPGADVRLADPGAPLRVVLHGEPAPEEVDRRILRGRPDLAALEAACARGEAELAAASAVRWPGLRIGPALSREAEGDWFLGLGFGIPIPIFDRNQGEIAGKEAQRARLRAEYAAALHAARAEAFDALERLRSARAEVASQESEVLPRAARALGLLERGLREGHVGVLEWIAARERALGARRAFLESAVRFQEALIDFETATGRPLGEPAAPGEERHE